MKRLATLLGLLALAGAATAKDLAGVYEDALHNDPTIRQADANRLAAREARPQAWSAVLPQIGANASVLRDHSSGYQDFVSAIPSQDPNQPPSLQVLPESSTIDTTTHGWSVNLRSNLFSWANWMQIKAASAEVAQAEANYKAAEQDLILRVATAYFLVLSAEAGVEANTASLEAITRQLDQANKRFEVGLIAITDVQDAKAGHDNAAAAVIQAKRLLATAQYRLQEITGQQYDHLARPGSDLPLKGPEPQDETAWVNVSLEQNLALISSRLAADIARDNVRAAFGGHLPTLDLVAGRSYTKGSSDQIIYGYPFNDVNNKFNDRQIGLQFTLPIFSGGYTQSKVRENEYRWIAAKEALVATSRATERQSRDAYLGVISGVARVQALHQARESTQTALKATEAGYDVGTRTSVDVLNARRVLVQAETDYANSKYDYIISVLQLRQAAGTLDRAQLLEVNAWLTVDASTAPASPTPQSVLPDVPPAQGAPPQPPPGGSR
ncbi:MAG: TolC family outer membrane protein [Proteobacteria bacterium]|nr:TolC family outer membrane protein [Pseudomonadota bacterium]